VAEYGPVRLQPVNMIGCIRQRTSTVMGGGSARIYDSRMRLAGIVIGIGVGHGMSFQAMSTELSGRKWLARM